MPEDRGLLTLLIAKAGCCLLLVSVLTGSSTSLLAWAAGAGLPWLVGGALLLAAGLLLLSGRRAGPIEPEREKGHGTARGSPDA